MLPGHAYRYLCCHRLPLLKMRMLCVEALSVFKIVEFWFDRRLVWERGRNWGVVERIGAEALPRGVRRRTPSLTALDFVFLRQSFLCTPFNLVWWAMEDAFARRMAAPIPGPWGLHSIDPPQHSQPLPTLPSHAFDSDDVMRIQVIGMDALVDDPAVHPDR